MSKDDPVVQRVRSVRQEIVAECGHDAHALLQWAKKIERTMPNRLQGYQRAKPKDS